MVELNEEQVRALAQYWGRIGGKVKSDAKTTAARNNSKRPRPNRKKKLPPL